MDFPPFQQRGRGKQVRRKPQAIDSEVLLDIIYCSFL